MTSQFEDSKNPHDPKYLHKPSDIFEFGIARLRLEEEQREVVRHDGQYIWFKKK